jgi:hypothetical protein
VNGASVSYAAPEVFLRIHKKNNTVAPLSQVFQAGDTYAFAVVQLS